MLLSVTLGFTLCSAFDELMETSISLPEYKSHYLDIERISLFDRKLQEIFCHLF